MRIVCDTNVLVSGFLFKGNPRKILRLASQGHVENYISPEILHEVEEVLRRPKFAVASPEIRLVIELFQRTFTLVTPTTRVNAVPRDQDDNAVIEAALEAGAAQIVSGDRHLRKLARWRHIGIVSPAQFLAAYRSGTP